jgi:hypothetical protein
MGLKSALIGAHKAGTLKVNQDANAVLAAAQKLKSLSKADLEARLDDPQSLLREVGVDMDDATAAALKERLDQARAGNIAQASIVHIDV